MTDKFSRITRSVPFFILAGLCELGGGYLVWLWLREDLGLVLGAIGGFVLFLYGVVPTLQKAPFHRAYAAYGGVFIVMAVLWGWLVDGIPPDNSDTLGTIIAIVGVLIIFYYPREKKEVTSFG